MIDFESKNYNLNSKNKTVFLTVLGINFFLFSANVAWAGDGSKIHWVSPTGSATWANCEKATDPGTNYCALATANSSALAGETAYLKSGVYLIDIGYGSAIRPVNSGNCPTETCLGAAGAKRIIFSAAPGETPILKQANATNKSYGLYLNGKNWIKVTSLTFKNFQGASSLASYVYLDNGASYNEISYNSFDSEIGYQANGVRGMVIGSVAPPWSTHNWIHHNYFSKRSNNKPCNEGTDLIRIGMAQENPISGDNNNTLESNYLEYGSHALLVTYGLYEVIRNNTAHNEPWITGCTSYDGSMEDLYGNIRGSKSLTSSTIGIGTKNFTIAAGLSNAYWVYPQPISIVYANDWSQAEYGLISSYNSVTGELAVNITRVADGASGTYANWILSERNLPYYTNPSFNGLYSHRVFCIGDSNLATPRFTLVEGNRLGFAGINPNNGGATNLDLQTPKNIVRYNFSYGAMANGINFKSANGDPAYSGGVRNYVYNNTVYRNGYGFNPLIYGGLNVGYSGQGIGQYSINRNRTDNVIKNNISFGNNRGAICAVGWSDPACQPNTPYNLDLVENNFTADPAFKNPDLSDPTSQNLFSAAHGYAQTPIPDLSLKSSSAAIDRGTHLTTAANSGTNSTTLIVSDALYFQDGTWGSDLARGVTFFPDWIAIGAISNVAQINSIDYANNIINLKSPISWSANAPVWLYKDSSGKQVLYGLAPDMGAYEYVQIGDAIAPSAPSGLSIN